MRTRFTRGFAAILVGILGTLPAWATWSIIVVDTRSHEIAIGSATCLTSFDLLRGLPVVRVGVGAAAAQSAIDANGANRRRIWDGLIAGADPEDILALLAARDPQHQSRQYGIVDIYGRAVTFTGSSDGAYANGLTGRSGTLVYAIQGNVITGQPVLDQAEAALLNTPGGLPEKLMAAMEAARAMGGDGRCSCSPANPPGCGSPPPNFTKAAHIGFMLDARRGDNDGNCSTGGCATGTYYMRFNVAFQPAGAPDPVIQLRGQFDAWRAGLINAPDQVESRVLMTATHMLDNAVTPVTMDIELRDWRGEVVDTTQPVEVNHDLDSAGNAAIGDVAALGNGAYRVTLTPAATPGIDRYAVTFVRGLQTRYLLPVPTLNIQDHRADLNHDGVVDLADLQAVLAAYGQSPAGDADGDGLTTLADLSRVLSNL